MDKDNTNRVTWDRFQEGANRVFFHTDLPGAWRYLTAGSTYLTLHDVDPDTANRISEFQAFCDEQFGSMTCAFKLFDLDKNGYVDITEFTRVLISFGYPGAQCKALFHVLDVDGNGRLSRQKLTFIDEWARAGEEEFIEEVWDPFAMEKLDAKKDTKEVELSPRLLELAVPKKPREEPKALGSKELRDLRMAELKEEILKGSSALGVEPDEDEDVHGAYDYDKIHSKNLALRFRTIHLLQRIEDIQDQEKIKLPLMQQIRKAAPAKLFKKKRSPYDMT